MRYHSKFLRGIQCIASMWWINFVYHSVNTIICIIQKCSAPKSGRSMARTPKKTQKVIPVDFGPNSIFSSKNAAKWRETTDLFFCWKVILLYDDTCYIILRRAIETRKVVGGDWCVKSVTFVRTENFFFWTGHSSSPRNFSRYSYLRPELPPPTW